MKTFDEYVSEWWHDYLTEHEDTEDFNLTAFNVIINALELKRDDVLTEDELPIDYLTALESDIVYDMLFDYNPKIDGMTLPDIPDTDTFLNDMFMQAVDESDKEYSFVPEFVSDMAMHGEGYSDPIDFFRDLQNGCQSGMIGMLIYNADCKRIYIEHIDDMEEFKYKFEEELGEGIRDKSGLYHYTFMCWLCYEELGFRIARNLFPNSF